MFKWNPFKSHSGKTLNWKIECDDLTLSDLDCIARMILSAHSFHKVISPPTKSSNMNHLLSVLTTHESNNGNCEYLIVDDVYTTGKSMEETRKLLLDNHLVQNEHNIKGVVMFSRNECPEWITPIFQLNKIFDT